MQNELMQNPFKTDLRRLENEVKQVWKWDITKKRRIPLTVIGMIMNYVHFIDLLSIRRSRYGLLSLIWVSTIKSNSMSLQLACTKFQQQQEGAWKNASKGSWGMWNFWGEKAVEVVVIVCMRREDAQTLSHPVRVKKNPRETWTSFILYPLSWLQASHLQMGGPCCSHND